MYLSDRDLEFAVKTGVLVVDPPPKEYDTTSIDLHLDRVEEAKAWDVDAYREQQLASGQTPLVCPGRFQPKAFSASFSKQVSDDSTKLVYREGRSIVVKRHGFFLWQTLQVVGTPEMDPRLICFVDGRSGSARTGLVVHMTAPTVHAGWWGKVTLEIANHGPFELQLHEGDPICQLTVAVISSPPMKRKKAKGIDVGQQHVTGQASAT